MSEHIDLTHIYRTFHPAATEYTFFSNAHGTVSRIDHTLGHERSLNKFKIAIMAFFSLFFLITIIQIIYSIVSDHGIKLDINSRRNLEKVTNVWKLNNVFLNKANG